MEENKETPQGEVKWNSDEVLNNGMSCKLASDYMTTWAATFREAAIIYYQGGPVPLSAWASEALATYMSAFSDQEKRKVLPNPEGYLPGFLMGAAAAVSNTSPEALAQLSMVALGSLSEMATKAPEKLAKSVVVFRVAKDGDGMKTHAAAVAPKDFIQSLSDQPEIAKKIAEIEKGSDGDPSAN